MNKNTYDISSIKRITKKFHVVVVQNMYNVQKKFAARAKLLYCQLELLLFFRRSLSQKRLL